MIVGLVLVALVLLAATSHRTGWIGALALVAVSVLWLRVNGPVEGLVLISLNAEHGLTVADLAGLAGLTLAGWRLARQPGGQRSSR